MSDSVIQVDGLGKKYILGQQKDSSKYSTLRDVVVNSTRSISRRFNRRQARPNISDFWALSNVSFDIERGDRVGIIGRNGAGKSTLLKVLSRITEPSEGRIRMNGRIASLLEVGTGFHPELTGRENIFLNGAILGMSKAEISRKFDEIVDFSEVEKFLDTPVKRYSSGMYVRLAFAVAAHLDPEILIVDEVLAVGDAQFQKKCIGKMENVSEQQGRTVLFVSHNMSAIEKLCNKGIFLDGGTTSGIQTIQQTINQYLGQNKSSVAVFENAPLSRVEALQVGEDIHITADYEVDFDIQLPALGFVLYDYRGNPVYGANPVVIPPKQPAVAKRSGTVTSVIRSPKLLNGTYRISIWFGNGDTDFFHEQDCLSIDVVNMAGVNQLPTHLVGPVLPECDWQFV